MTRHCQHLVLSFPRAVSDNIIDILGDNIHLLLCHKGKVRLLELSSKQTTQTLKIHAGFCGQMLNHYSKLQKNLMTTLGRKRFHSLEILIYKYSLKFEFQN